MPPIARAISTSTSKPGLFELRSLRHHVLAINTALTTSRMVHADVFNQSFS